VATAYVTPAILAEKFSVQLQEILSAHGTNLADGDSIATNEHLLNAIATANSHVDYYVRVKHTPSTVAEDAQVVQVAATIAFYTLVRNFNPLMMSEGMREEYADAVKFLRDLASGKASGSLTTPSESVTGASNAPVAVVIGSEATTASNALERDLAQEAWMQW